MILVSPVCLSLIFVHLIQKAKQLIPLMEESFPHNFVSLLVKPQHLW
jgi:hypothetical protein